MNDCDVLSRIPEEYTAYDRPETVFIGYDGDIRCNGTTLLVRVEKDSIHIIGDISAEKIYFNYRQLQQRKMPLTRGDNLILADIKVEFFPDHIRVYGEKEKYETRLESEKRNVLPWKNFPDYKRSPRIIKRVPTDKLELKNPPTTEKNKRGELAMTILPPLATLAVTVGIGLIMGRGGYLLMSVGVSIITTAVSVIRFFSDRKEKRELNENRKRIYLSYLLRMRKRIFSLYEREKETYRYNYPDMQELERMVNSYCSRIYERNISDKDFLTVSIGTRMEKPCFEVCFQENELESGKDELYLEAEKLKKEYEQIEKTKVIDLKTSQLGIVGEKKLIHKQLQVMISQLCVFQSYHDLQIIAVYNEQYADSFTWMKWLPHCHIQTLNVRGLIDTENVRDQILNSLYQILKERNQKLEESKKEARFRPHFLFIIDEPQLIMDHSIMELLEKDGNLLGFSVIYTSYLRANLPEHVGTVFILNNAEEGVLLLEDKVYRNETVKIQDTERVNLELFARTLGVLRHVLGTTSHIPESITFYQMYQVQNPEELHVPERWRGHHADKSLAVPLGVRAQDDIVELNLHEKAHGPHGLVAGTTGSGKSEIIQSYILSLAVNFHPHEVGFLLIDYKGGGMAGLFRELPHLLGTITNLDGSESMRALASIKSELARRQKIFSDNNVNHINGYMELFREGVVKEPIPHLFLISDEFAELKKEQPEFMKELVSTARIGRSLGVHLILATQKPTGVVDDQIWSNSKFKLALKVQDEADSKEIIKTPDAATITQPGRAYLQVGNNEIYELFQSAWSGAAYIEEQDKEVTSDNRVYMVNRLGQGVLINQDLGGSRAEKASRKTQLDVTIDYIRQEYEKEDPIPVRKPWLPPLGEHLISPLASGEEKACRLPDFIEKQGEDDLVISLGLLDIPEEQRQTEYKLNLQKDGNLLYIASGGYGKSVLLSTTALSFAWKYDVDRLHLFLLDFGNNALVALQRLPHTSEYITLDDKEKYEKFKKLMTKELAVRKKLLAGVFAQNFQVYNETAPQKLPAWIVLVDNFDAVKEMGFEEEEYFTRVTRDGVSLGIYFIITASRTNAVRGATFNNFKNKIGGYNFEKNELLTLVGRSPYTLPEIKGRALTRYGERVSVMQIYAMVPFASDTEYRKNMQDMIERIREKNEGSEAPHMPVMPEELDMKEMERFCNQDIDLFVGLDTENVTLQGVSYRCSPYMILGAAASGKTNLLRVFLHQLEGRGYVVIFDSLNKDLKEYEGREGIRYIKNLNEFVGYMDELEREVISREKKLQDKHDMSEEEVIGSFTPYVIMIDDLSSFFSHQTTAEADIAAMFVRASDVGIMLIATNLLNKFYGGDPVTELFKRAVYGTLVSPQGHMGIAPVDMDPGAKEGTLYRKGKGIIVRIPKA